MSNDNSSVHCWVCWKMARFYSWERCKRHTFDEHGRALATFLPEGHTACGWHQITPEETAPEPKLLSREDWVQLSLDFQ